MIFLTLTCWLYLFIFIFYINKVEPIKRSKFKITSTTCIVAILSGLILFYFSGSYGRFLVIVMEIILFKFLFLYSWFRTLYITVFFEISIAASEWTVGIIVVLFNIPYLGVDNNFYLFYLIFSLFFAFIYNLVFTRLYSFTIYSNYPRYSWIILILPFITYFFAINISDFFFSFKTPLILIFIFFGLIISNFIMLFLYYYSIQTIQMKNELLLLNQKEAFLKEKVDVINQNYDLNFSFLHQLLHDCSLLNIYEEQNDKEKMHDLINKISDRTCRAFNTICTNSSTFNSILNSYLKDIQTFNIDVETWIDCNISSIEYADQIILFQSIFDFCIGEARNSQEDMKIINVCVKEVNSKIAIKTECTWNGLNQYSLQPLIQEKYSPYFKTSNHDSVYVIFILFKKTCSK